MPLADRDQLPQSLIQFAARTGETILSGDAVSDESLNRDEYVRNVRPFSVLCLPVIQRGKLLGVLYLENDISRNAFRQDRVSFLRMLATQAMISLGYARLLSERMDQQRAREKIYAELHDNLGAYLTDIQITAERLQSVKDETAAARLSDSLKHNANRALAELRERLQSRDDIDLLEKDFAEGLRTILLRRYMSAGRRIRMAFEPADAALLSESSRTLLFSVCRELATNDLKYGQAECRFELGRANGMFELRVVSHKKTDAVPERTGMGLENIRQRMEAAGGSIESREENDSYIFSARLPLSLEPPSLP